MSGVRQCATWQCQGYTLDCYRTMVLQQYNKYAMNHLCKLLLQGRR